MDTWLARQDPEHCFAVHLNLLYAMPVGHGCFPKEVLVAPRAWCEAAFNVVHWTDMPRGGHFAALEQPELLLEDDRAFFRRFRSDLRARR
jgi:hypothetical protein